MKKINKCYDLVITGGGLSGVCAAVSAARHGVKTALIHNRPVLGGNASSEIRMHICGADDHASRPNARETGIIEEIQLENKHRNPTHSYPIFDSVLWGFCLNEENLDLYLNTHVITVACKNQHIVRLTAIQMTTETEFEFEGTYFVDATGDGFIGAEAGAEYRIGREGKDQYGEKYAPEQEDDFTMGSSLMFQAKRTEKKVPFITPDWAYHFTEDDLRNREHNDIRSGYWWIELGGYHSPVIDNAEEIYNELLRSVYGIWDHLKNGGDHQAEYYDLEWVGTIPGRRESRRLLGDYVLTEQDCLEGRRFEDAVAYGGWPMDVHIPGGLRTQTEQPTVWLHLKDTYTIPYRCLYSKNIDNLFLAGRAISCSHMAFASTRVMGTCAVVGQAVGTAAAIALKNHCIHTPFASQKVKERLEATRIKNQASSGTQGNKAAARKGASKGPDGRNPLCALFSHLCDSWSAGAAGRSNWLCSQHGELHRQPSSFRSMGEWRAHRCNALF